MLIKLDFLEYCAIFISVTKVGSLTDDERRGLERKGKELNKLLLSLVGDSWSTQTALSWYKTLIADKYNSVAPGRKKRGKKRIPKELQKSAKPKNTQNYPLAPRTTKAIIQSKNGLPLTFGSRVQKT